MGMDFTPAQHSTAQCSTEYQNMEMKNCTWSYLPGNDVQILGERERESEREKQHTESTVEFAMKKRT